jgi:hypothetical protein
MGVNVAVSRSAFAYNSAGTLGTGNGGGAVYVGGNVTSVSMDTCQLTGNTAHAQGGAVMLKGQTMHVSFSAVTWRANTAQGDVTMYPEGAQGGALYIGSAGHDRRITSNTFTGNTLGVDTASSSLVIRGNTLTNNAIGLSGTAQFGGTDWTAAQVNVLTAN